jgi:hypothetical protein
MPIHTIIDGAPAPAWARLVASAHLGAALDALHDIVAALAPLADDTGWESARSVALHDVLVRQVDATVGEIRRLTALRESCGIGGTP